MTVTNTVYSLHSRLSCLENMLKTDKEKKKEKGEGTTVCCLILTSYTD